VTFTYTPAHQGVKTITVANNAGLTGPAPVAYTVHRPAGKRTHAGRTISGGIGTGIDQLHRRAVSRWRNDGIYGRDAQ
jgi:hypothetical protein